MIISASRRTDIPAFYADWLMNRLRDGYCLVANPWNPKQIGRISLLPEDVDAIVFWSKNPAPLVRHLDEIGGMGFRYYFLYTLNHYPAWLEPGLPPLRERIRTFLELAARIGGERVVWRYDPIVISGSLTCEYHRRTFGEIAGALSGATGRVIVSVVDFYSKTLRRLSGTERRINEEFVRDPFSLPEFGGLVADMLSIAGANSMQIQGCAEDDRLARLGIRPGKCIDGALIRNAFGIEVAARKDRGQRDKCLCVESRDIGATDSCVHGCEYCYSTSSPEKAMENRKTHDPSLPMLICRG